MGWLSACKPFFFIMQLPLQKLQAIYWRLRDCKKKKKTRGNLCEINLLVVDLLISFWCSRVCKMCVFPVQKMAKQSGNQQFQANKPMDGKGTYSRSKIALEDKNRIKNLSQRNRSENEAEGRGKKSPFFWQGKSFVFLKKSGNKWEGGFNPAIIMAGYFLICMVSHPAGKETVQILWEPIVLLFLLFLFFSVATKVSLSNPTWLLTTGLLIHFHLRFLSTRLQQMVFLPFRFPPLHVV